MALSNIFNEPRREIMETVVGIAVLILPALADYWFAVWFYEVTGPDNPCPVPLGMTLGILLAAIMFFGLLLIHALGDGVCNALQRRDIHLRPKNRPNA